MCRPQRGRRQACAALRRTGIVKLASNENPLGMSPRAVAAAQQVLAGGARYPDANGHDLKQALARHYGVDAGWITLGNGSNDILELAARALVGPGQGIIHSRYAFIVYPLVAQAIGAVGIEVPDAGLGHDLAAMLAAITPETRMVFIANPNNPTGTFIPGDALLRFLEQVPPQVAVVLDEAYTEYLAPEQRYDALAWVKRFPNLLEGLRAGGPAGGLCRGAARADRPDGAGAAALQCQQRRAGGRRGGAGRCRLPDAQLPDQP